MTTQSTVDAIYASDGFKLLSQYTKDRHAYNIMAALYIVEQASPIMTPFEDFNDVAADMLKEQEDEPDLSAQEHDVTGWQLVPKEPTQAMVIAYNKVGDDLGLACYPNARLVYRAMLDAAPTKQEQSQDGEEKRSE